MAKIVVRSELRELADSLRQSGKKIVTFNGAFDVLHAGHVRCFAEAGEQGDALIVLVNSDASVRGYKGSGRPIVPEQERVEMIAALSCVDYVAIFDDANPKTVISEIRPDVHCNGADWGPGCIERETVEDCGGRLHILKWAPGHATSELLKKICSLKESPRAVFLPKAIVIQALRPGFDGKLLSRVVSKGFRIALFAEEPRVAAGEVSMEEVNTEMEKIRSAMERSGLRLDGVYVCAHAAQGDPVCKCRPPLGGLLEQARDELDLALASSWVVSDDMRHIVMGREVNAKTALVGTCPDGYVLPHVEAGDLAGALSLIAS
jgi:rfaE bifunctional protein nucleotidyltransferase chain/domain